MPTYTKETALYDTGAIKEGIDNAGTKAEKYITKVDNAGITVHPYNDSTGSAVTNNRAVINAEGMTIYKNNEQRAKFGQETIIGKPYDQSASNNESHVKVNYHSLQLIDKEGNEYFHVSDLRDADGNVTEMFTGDGVNKTFEMLNAFDDVVSVKVNDVSVTYTKGPAVNYAVTLATAPANGATVAVTYTPTDGTRIKAYTIGTRASGSGLAAFSLALGSDVTANGRASLAEGNGTTASGYCSHAEGLQTTASGSRSHAEGDGSVASGTNSHAEGNHTVALFSDQTVVGRFNKTESGPFIVGLGSSDGNRKNVFRIDSLGNVFTAKGNYSYFDEAQKTSIKASDYSNHTNLYYEAEGYHSFYAFGSGVVYLAEEYAQFNTPITSGSSSKKLLARSTVSKDNQTIAGSGTKYGTITIDASKSGYTPIGVLGYDISNASSSGANSSYISVYEARISGSNVSISVRNNHSSAAAKIKVAATVLYTPSTQGIDSI